VYDSSYQEVTDLAFDSTGALFAALISMEVPQETPPQIQKRNTEGQTNTKREAQLLTTARAKTQSAIFRVDKEGVIKKFWESTSLMPLQLTFQESDLIVGTGNDGKLLRLNRNGDATLLSQVGQAQITSIKATQDGNLYLGTSNLGSLLAISMPYAKKGVYTSLPRDTGVHATWGSLSWEGHLPEGTSLRFFTRSGNSDSPDPSWSKWAGPYEAQEANHIDSPTARYLQWKTEFVSSSRSDTPRLRQTKISYLPNNAVPTIQTITIHPPGIIYPGSQDSDRSTFDAPGQSTHPALQEGPPPDYSRTLSGRGEYHQGMRTMSWQAEDQNGDQLVFHLHIRRTGGTHWSPLGLDLAVNSHQWETNALRDGEYVVKLTASDAPSNPEGYAAQTERLSDPFYIDHTPPMIRGARTENISRALHVTFSVQDKSSPIRDVQYSVDFGSWKLVFPDDLIADSLSERYTLQIQLPDDKPHSITLRATDSGGNSVFRRIAVPLE